MEFSLTILVLFFFYSSPYGSGDTDAIIPVTSTRYSINALKLPTIKPWHAWYDDGQVSFFRENDSKKRISFSKIIQRNKLNQIEFLRNS